MFYKRNNALASLTKIMVSLAAFSSVVGAAVAKGVEVEAVPLVDLAQYLGKWYEVARLPQIFETGCTAVTAEYSLNSDGSVKVFNSCRLFDPVAGIPISITGRASPVDSTNAKLEVAFFNGLSKGKYWVLEIDPGYQWAMVGDPDRRSLYILARNPILDEGIYNELVDLAKNKHGYNIERLIKSRQ